MTIARIFPRSERSPVDAHGGGTPLAPTTRPVPAPQPEPGPAQVQPFARPAAIERFTNPLFPARRVAVVRRRDGASPVAVRPTPVDGA